MSLIDQCPSTTKGEKKKPGKAELAAIASRAGTIHGKRAWRSVEEIADTEEFREFLHREFPAGASELNRSEGETRRDFLKLMGASLALAGAATIPGCRQPDHKIMPYSKDVPEDIIPGKPLYYATSFPRPDGGAEGLLVETHEGRPTKIEGNPLHPINQGKCSTWALASIMGMYDPDRLKYPEYNNPFQKKRLEATWDDFRKWAGEHFAAYDASGGEGLAFVCDKQASPTRQAAIKSLRQRFPKAVWVSYAPSESTAGAEGAKIAFGKPMRELLNLSKDKTRIIVSLDRDFLYHEAGEVTNARQFAATRLVLSTKDDMSRLYCVESGFSITGAQADHRMRLAPSLVTAFAVALAKRLAPIGDPGFKSVAGALANIQFPSGTTLDQGFVDGCANDLLAPENHGKSLILAGESQPAEVHALVAAMNAALGNIGQSVSYMPLNEEEAYPSLSGIADLAAQMKAGKVTTLVCINTNPVYDAPGDLDFASLFAKVPSTITLTVDSTETAAASTWSLNAAHYLESWGDTQAIDGTRAPVQPMIAPLYEPAMSSLEFIALLASKDPAARIDGYEIVRNNWRQEMGAVAGDFDRRWRRILHDGVVPGTFGQPETPACDFAGVSAKLANLAGKGAEGFELVWTVGHLHDGRYANCAWLQELPEVGTRTVWDNTILVSPKTAEDLKLTPEGYSHSDPSAIYTKPTYPMARHAEVSVGGLKVKGPVWILPGMADNTIMMALGYGREKAGRVGDGVGFNAYQCRPSTASGGRYAAKAQIAASDGERLIASTQMHWSLEGRTSLVRAEDLQRFKKFGDVPFDEKDETYGGEKKLNFAEQLGELAGSPPVESIYKNPFNQSKGAAAPGSQYTVRPQWGMTIDQTVCTGCGACTIACQSENNIAVVGKKEVAKGREMHWIRVDRYYTGDVDSPDAMYHQPVACVHCENAPCETVCPVNATIHGPEGINYMTYNRCIGTRYCANNCPYKVRRFNFFDYGVTKFNGDYFFKEIVEDIAPDRGGITGSGEHNKVNPNLIPPRLRQKLDEISRMQKNPDVTVRSRGVMEKCSYCIQRINAARIEFNLQQNMDPKVKNQVPDGFFQVACQQACPSHAITFGDILDETSKIHAMKNNARSYWLLGFLNTRPRTSHMLRLSNPNPALCSAERRAMWDTPLMEHGGKEGGGEKSEHAFRFDPNKRSDDRGYALSLRILGARA